jgi:CubicO group peptidase (beta-lactamase class C family)
MKTLNPRHITLDWKILPLSLILALFVFSCQADPDLDSLDFSEAEALMDKAVASAMLPSISVAVSKSGRIVWEKSVGFANIENAIEATPTTAYSLASISKPITATGLMILVERGLVDLSRPANDYLGESKLYSYTEDPSQATVLRVLNHTSGMVTHWHFFYADDPYPRPSMDDTIRRYGVLIWPPGSRFMYSNLGYGILDTIIERVSGRSYPEFLSREVFEPLGMQDSAVFLEPGPEDRVARRYMGKEKLIPFYDFDHRGGSAVYCSARDLLRFGMFHLKNSLRGQKKIISDETIDLMKTLSDPDVEGNDYRLGWSRSYLARYEAYSHGGGMPGVSTNLLLIPELDIALVLLCNARFGGLRPIGQAILKQLIPGLEEDMKKHGRPQPKPEPPAKETPESLLGRWEGRIYTWEGEIPVELLIEEGKKVKFRLLGKWGEEDQKYKTGLRVQLHDGSLQATFFQKLPLEDAARQGHQTSLDLVRDGDLLTGSASAYAINTRFGLPSYISLSRTDRK